MIVPLAEDTSEEFVELSELTQTFQSVSFNDEIWDLTHLDAFTFKADIGFEVTVLVTFSSHCFTHSFTSDSRNPDIPKDEIFDDGRDPRVLNPQRYDLSRRLLRPLVLSLDKRRIVVANARPCNFMTVQDDEGMIYAVFFNVEKSKRRRKRLILRIQSAYPLEAGLSKKQSQAQKVNLIVLLKAMYDGHPIRA